MLEKNHFPSSEIFHFEKRQATEQSEEKFSWYIQQVFEPLKEMKVKVIKGEEKVSPPDRTKGKSIVGHVNIKHQVLEEGIGNTFIFENSCFIDEEKGEGYRGLDFDGAHSRTWSGVGIVLR